MDSDAGEQLRRIGEIRDEWYAVGTSTQPADRPAAETAVSNLYEAIGVSAPAFIWVDSPYAAVVAAPFRPDGSASLQPQLQAALRAAMETIEESSWATVVEAVRDDPTASMWASVCSHLGLSPQAALWSATRVSLGDSLERSLAATVAAEVRAALTDPVREATLDEALWGQQEAGWIAYHDARRRLGVATFTEDAALHLDLWGSVARSCGWWWPYPQVCVLSERPALVAMQPWPTRDAPRLHCEDGPAVRFRDGWEVYAWRGTRVPRSFIESTWTVTDILAESDFDVRQCAIERMGWARFLEDAAFSEAAPAVPEPDDNGTLALYDVPDGLFDVPARMLVWAPADPDYTGREHVFAAPVPKDTVDPVEAYEWTTERADELRMYDVSISPA